MYIFLIDIYQYNYKVLTKKFTYILKKINKKIIIKSLLTEKRRK
jgi:hypothetical protein